MVVGSPRLGRMRRLGGWIDATSAVAGCWPTESTYSALTLGISRMDRSPIGALLADTFAFAQIWLPPEGADSAIFVHPMPRLRWTNSSPFRARKDGPRDAGLRPQTTSLAPRPRTRGGRDLVFKQRHLNPSGISTATLEADPALGAITDLLNSDTQPWAPRTPRPSRW